MGKRTWAIKNEHFYLSFRPKDTRTWFQRDIDQITHSIAFRKLQYKSQLLSEADPISRSRLIHTIEASRIATEISGRLHLNKELTEAIMLGHDIASSPYGFVGNNFLKEKVPNFNHELGGAIMLQTLSREKLPRDHEKRPEILDIIEKNSSEAPFYSAQIPSEFFETSYPLYASIKRKEDDNGDDDIYIYAIAPCVVDGVLCHGDGYKKTPETLEGQVVKFADNIAYITQDIDDLLRADIMSKDELEKIGLPSVFEWDKIDNGYNDEQKLKNIFKNSRGKRIAALIERYVKYNKKLLDDTSPSSGKMPVLACDEGLQKVIDKFWSFIKEHYVKPHIEISNSLQIEKLKQLWKILEENEEKIKPYNDFIDNCCLDTRFSQYKKEPGWLCAYFISHLSWYEVDLIIDSYHRRDYSFTLDIDIDGVQ